MAPELLTLAKNRFDQLYSDKQPSEHALAFLALSDFAFTQLQRHPDWLLELDNLSPQCYYQLPAEIQPCELAELSEVDFFNWIREQRQFYWLKVAWLDLVLKQDIGASMKYVSQLADYFIEVAYRWAWQQVSVRHGQPMDKNDQALPMLILGMGKLGGQELNYSSDIDLILTYPEQGETQGGRKPIEHSVFYNKVAQKMIAALDQVTEAGRVFRVDMRLRPFGDSGPLVMSFTAMEEYYQEQGRDWERYAMLKARIIGPSSQFTKEFYQLLKPFVYRRYIDFSVIESLRKMKQMIAQEVRRKRLKHNIKLGAGGIREVEFVVQALQLIRGGREVSLQTQSLLQAITALVRTEDLPADIASQLHGDYLVLRTVEQYLQQFADAQTQTLPDDPLNQARLVELLECNDFNDVLMKIEQVMLSIHQEFNLVVGADEEELDPLLSEFEHIWHQAAVDDSSDWSIGSEVVAMTEQLTAFKSNITKRKIGRRGRDILERLGPLLLQQLAELNPCARVLGRVLNVIEKVASRTAYLELLIENRGTLKQLVKLCDCSPWIGEQLARYPILLDELIDPAALYKPVPLDTYANEIHHYMLRINQDDLEQQMEGLRQFKQAHQLRIAAADVTCTVDVMKISDHLTYLAEAIVEQAVNLAWQQMVARYGYPNGASDENKRFAVLAYGKAGGLELGYDSDLDLVFVHNCDGLQSTNGAKQIDSRQFYLKLVQRIMHLFNTRTNSGILYEMDTRLRPEGGAGLLAVHIDTFAEYQHQKAWTWEHQALVRARMIFGTPELEQQYLGIRHEVLCKYREIESLQQEVVNMREKMRAHLATGDQALFDLKQDAGGMADIEFIAQYIVLGFSRQFPELSQFTDNVRIFEKAEGCGLLSKQHAQLLIRAYCEYRAEYHRLSLRQLEKRTEDKELAQLKSQVSLVWQALLTSK